MTFEQITELAQLGAIPMLTIAVIALWRSLESTRREFIDYLKESAKRGDIAAQNAIEKKSNA